MPFFYIFKALFTDPRWFFKYGLWQWLHPHNLYKCYIKWPFQKIMQGFSDPEVWSLDYTIAKFVLPRLKNFRKFRMGAPGSFFPYDDPSKDEERFAKWDATIDKMIRAMELSIKHGNGDWPIEAEQIKRELQEMRVGYRLFGKYFGNLWD